MSGKKKFFIAILFVLIIGYVLNLLTYWDIYHTPHKTWNLFALVAYSTTGVLFFTRWSHKYKEMFLVMSSMFLLNMMLSHFLFYPYELGDQLEHLFSRDIIFIVCLIALTGYIVNKVHVIWQTSIYVLILLYYFFLTDVVFIKDNFGLCIITGIGYIVIYYIIYSTLDRFIYGLNKYGSELEYKNQQITDSIRYAQRIQKAILPHMKTVQKYLKKSFILYKSKDIVAGDFYWFELIDDVLLFAVADCCGHGVPGAMISFVCNNALNRAVREYGLTDPGEILEKTNEIVIEEFEKSNNKVQDGMDIALCSLQNNQLKLAGAQNPMWLHRDGEIIITKGTKHPIDKYALRLKFETHQLLLKEKDIIYLFSDGYNDQFGGPKDRKFMAGNLRKMIQKVDPKSIPDQCKVFEDTFEHWKDSNEQIDDVCVMGVEF